MNENNGAVVMRMPDKTKSFLGSLARWLMRLALLLASGAIFWVCKLILAGVLYLVNTLPAMQASLNTVKGAVEQLQSDVSSIKANAVTKDEMHEAISAAEARLKVDFTKQINQQLKNRRLQTGPTAGER